MTTYTPSSPYTTSYTFQNLVSGDLAFSSINAVETDYGVFASFTDTAPDPGSPLALGSLLGFGWIGGYEALVSGPNSSSTFTISYNVDVTDPTQSITSLQQLYVVDSLIGPGASASASEQVFDSAGNLLTTLNWSSSGTAATGVNLVAGYQHLTVKLTVNLSIDATGIAASAVGMSGIEQNFGQTALSQLSSFTTHVYFDANANGAQDTGETNLAGVTVMLLTGTGAPTGETAVTDANGNVSFTNLLPGSYEVSVVTPAGDRVSQSTNVSIPVTLLPGQTANAIEGVYAPQVDLSVSKTDGKTSVVAGTTDTYTITVSNNGSSPVTSFTLSDAVPSALLHPVFGTASAGSYDPNTGLWTGLNLATGQSVSITLTGTIDPTATGSVTNQVTVTPASGYTDTNPGNNTASDTDTISQVVDLSVTKTDGKTSVVAGGVDTYTITVSNNGPSTVSSFNMVDSIPAALLNPVFGAPSAGSYNATTGLWNGLSLASGQSVSITVSGTIDPGAAGATYTASGTGQDGAENATATITTENNEIIVTLASGVINPTAAGQEVSGIQFTLGNVPVSASLVSASGNLINIAAGGAVTAYSGSINHWGVAQSGSTLTLATAGTGAVGGKPVDLIIGSGPYTNANASITGRNPQIQGPATFVLNAPGVTAGTTITSVKLEFGTGPDAVLAGSSSGSSNGSITNSVTVTPTGGATDSNPSNNTASDTDIVTIGGTTTGGGSMPPSSGLTVLKLPSQVVVGTCGQVTYTFDVINTGSTALTNVQISDNIGTAANPNYITPVLQTATTNGVLGVGETWVYTATINESGDYTSKSSSACHTVSGQDLSSGCTAWLNSSFTPTSCKDGATYNFQNINCTITGPYCGTQTVQVPNACVTFSKNCTQPTTNYDASQNCWVTTLPAGCSPGNVFLSGLPYQVPSGCNLSGATVTWNIGQSGNNCGTSNVAWQTGCTGYSSFNQNGCDGQNDYNQIGVKICDSGSSYGSGGDTSQGYGWNYGDSGGYCGGYWGSGWNGGWSGCGSDWNGSGNDCAGTPENQYTGGDCSYGSYGGYNCYGGYGYYGSYGSYGSYGNDNGGTCNNGGGTGTVYCGQPGDSPQADTATVSASTLGSGFSLGDAANYGIIAFGPSVLKGSSNSPITGNVGVGTYTSSTYTWCGLNYGGTTTSYQLNTDKITGKLVATGATPSNTGGTVTAGVSGNSATLSADISALQALSTSLAGETGTSVALSSGLVINATSGKLDAAGDYVFTITKWANNITINGDGTHNVVLNLASSAVPVIDNVTLTGGLTANQVLFNDQDTDTILGTSGTTFNGTFLAPNAVFSVSGATVNGHLFGGASGQTFAFTSGATLNTPANATPNTPTTTTVAASDSAEIQVLASNSPISLNGTAPTGSLSALYGTGAKLELAYNPSNTVSLKQIQAGLASVSGSNSNAMAFLEITNNSNPYAANASIYFEGEVTSGEKIFADATINQLTNTSVAAPNNHFSTVAGADIYAYVFTSQSAFQNNAAPVQTMAYNTSGSQAMHFGDQIGSLTVIGYVGSNGGHLVS